MENASKALLIAGGVLIVIILVSLIMIVKNNVTNFYASQDELQEIADKTKFNEQFTRFNRNDVAGYELISLSNKIIDYNERLSSEGKNNVEQGEPVEIAITIWDNSNTKISKDKIMTLFCAHDEYGFCLFKPNASTTNKYEIITKSKLTQDRAKNTELKKILDEITNINTPKIEILTKKVYKIMPNNFVEIKTNKFELKNKSSLTEADREKMIDAISSYRTAVGDQNAFQYNSSNLKDKYIEMLNSCGMDILKYYEYTQFLKAKFKCKKLEYSESTGKVISLEFECTGEIE